MSYSIETTPVTISSVDGFPLKATIFHPSTHSSLITISAPSALLTSSIPPPSNKPAIIISAATGCSAHFYAHLAKFLARLGCVVIIYDYRAVGGSIIRYTGELDKDHKATLKNFPHTDILSWAGDANAVFDHLVANYPDREYQAICHSVGGHFVPLLKQRERLSRVLFVGVNSAFSAFDPSGWRSKVFFKGLVPLFTTLFGYFPSKSLGFFEDLPSGVAKNWSRWASQEQYMCGDKLLPHLPKLYASCDLPILSISFSDDEFSTKEGFESYLAMVGSNNAIKVHVHLRPKDVGCKTIGHNGFFAKGSEELWKALAVDWVLKGSTHHLKKFAHSKPKL